LADLDAILELFAESGVPVVTLERSPMLSLWLRRLALSWYLLVWIGSKIGKS